MTMISSHELNAHPNAASESIDEQMSIGIRGAASR